MFLEKKIMEKVEVKETYYEEAMRYIHNAKEELRKAGKDGLYYKDPKYVKAASGIAYAGVEKAAKWFLRLHNIKVSIKNVNQIKEGLSGVNNKALSLFNSAYATLHIAIYYQDERRIDIVKSAFQAAEEFIAYLKPYKKEKVVY